MTEVTTEQTSTAAETTATPSPTLEEIAREIPVEEQAKSFTAQPQPQSQPPAQPYIPDPVVDSEGYKRYVAQEMQARSSLETTLKTVSERLSNFEQTIEKQRLDADVDRAVKTVNGKVKMDPDFVEAALEVEYRKNPSFKHIWDNRQKNPAAFEKALNVVADKMAGKFQVRQDPQIAENVRAAQSSQRNMATTKQQTQNDEWANLSPAEFEAKWSRMIHGG